MNHVLVSIGDRFRAAWLWLRGWKAAIALLRDPNKLDEVFALDRMMPKDALARLVAAAKEHPDGRIALRDRPRVDIDLPQLRALPAGTFGRAVADFFDRNGLDPASIPRLEVTDDLSYINAHLYETHDVWHVATGFGTTVAEELGLQAVYATQLPAKLAPLLVAGGLLQAVLWVQDDFGARLAAIARGHAMAKRARPLLGVRWGEMWPLPLDEVRARLSIEPRETSERAAHAQREARA
jgi:ubiquinone biosynthesis protein COQ4